MEYDPTIYHRRSIRLKNYDYSKPGAYFVTICTHSRGEVASPNSFLSNRGSRKTQEGRETLPLRSSNRRGEVFSPQIFSPNYLSEVVNGNVVLSQLGENVLQCWNELHEHYNHIKLDFFVVMPNHIHGIIMIRSGEVLSPNIRSGEVSSPSKENSGLCGQGRETLPLQQQRHEHTLGQIIAYFKYQSTKQINQLYNISGIPVWQRNYYEHVIRNENELNKIREYIQNNPLKWHLDRENPERVGSDNLEDEIFSVVST